MRVVTVGLRNHLPAFAATFTATLTAFLISRAVPLAGPLLVALLLGILLTNAPWAEHRAVTDHAPVTSFLLRLGVVLVGAQLPLSEIVTIGWRGGTVVIGTVAATYIGTRYLGSRLGLEEPFVTLLAAGFSICGAAAVAAVSDAVRARQRDIALAVAMVTIFGSIMMIVIPWAASTAGLSEHLAAMWAGASIHEVAQVFVAASLVGTSALATASVVKLGRVALLAPIYFVSSRASKARGPAVPLIPWFVLGFIAMAAVRSSGALGPDTLRVVGYATTLFLAAGMFGLGLGCRFEELWPVPPRALLLALLSSCIAAMMSLALILTLY